ncbi:MAG: FecR family protein [Mangrovibacterium sp.]
MKASYNHSDEKWAGLAKQLFDKPSFESSGITDTDWDEAELNETRQTAYQIDFYFAQKQFSPAGAWLQVQRQIHQPNTGLKRASLLWWRVAAVLLVAVLLGGGVFWASRSWWQSQWQQLVQASQTELSRVVLPDGSVVTLNYGSKLHFSEKFDGVLREVSLSGEAFFEVTPNPGKPFLIHAGKASIEVLGTSFNVDASRQNGLVSVVVATGRVQVSLDENTNNSGDLILAPGEKGVLDVGESLFQKSLNSDPNYLAWKTHAFEFSKTSLKDVIQQLNKVYRVQIATADPNVGELLLTARFDKQPVSFMLEVIAATHDLAVEDTGGGQFELKKK